MLNFYLHGINRLSDESQEGIQNMMVTIIFIEINSLLKYSWINDILLKWKYIHGTFNKFPDVFCTGICCRFLKIQYVIVIHLMRWLTNFYDFRFKSTATAAIGIHPAKAWLPQLVNFKNAIWIWGHFRRMICNKILF